MPISRPLTTACAISSTVIPFGAYWPTFQTSGTEATSDGQTVR